MPYFLFFFFPYAELLSNPFTEDKTSSKAMPVFQSDAQRDKHSRENIHIKALKNECIFQTASKVFPTKLCAPNTFPFMMLCTLFS